MSTVACNKRASCDTIKHATHIGRQFQSAHDLVHNIKVQRAINCSGLKPFFDSLCVRFVVVVVVATTKHVNFQSMV